MSYRFTLLFQQAELISLQSVLQYFSNNNNKYILRLGVTYIFIPQHPLKLCLIHSRLYLCTAVRTVFIQHTWSDN